MASSSAYGPTDEAAALEAALSANAPTDEAAAVEAEDEQSSPDPEIQDTIVEHIWNTATTFKEFKKRVMNIDADKVRALEEEHNEKRAAKMARRQAKMEKKLMKHPEKGDALHAKLASKMVKPFFPGRVPGQEKKIEEKRMGPVPPGPVKPGPRRTV